MKKAYLILLFILFTGCKETTVNGYFYYGNKGQNNKYNSNTTYYRFNQDTIVAYNIRDQKIDSIVHYWNGKGYIILGSEADKIYGGFGDGKYIVINKDNIRFNTSKTQKTLDSIKDTTSIEAIIATFRIKIATDTLKRINKKYFYHFLEEDKKKDSILYNSPFIDNSTIRNTVSQFIENRIEGEVFGKLINNSISIDRINDDSFRVRFKTIRNYGFKEDHRYIFDANMENWSIKRDKY